MKALVTGGAGFIGSHLVDLLCDEGIEVCIVDDMSRGSLENLERSKDRARLVRGDIRSIGGVIENERPEVILHLAAQADVRVSVNDPALDADVNIIGSLRVLEAARKADVRKVVFASSGGCVYGESSELPTKETSRGLPESPYGISKRVLHDYLAFYEKTYGLDHVVLALSNVCGPRQDPYGEAGVVAMFLGAMLDDKPTIIYGDGSQTRDFVYVADVAGAFRRAIDHGHGVYNVGTGIETSVRELWRACADATGYAKDPDLAPARSGELQRSCLDPSRAAQDLGWQPATKIEDAVAATAEHIRANRSSPGPLPRQ